MNISNKIVNLDDRDYHMHSMNDVNVIFGVEAGILDENGNVDFLIQGGESEFINLSAHIDIYKGSGYKISCKSSK